MKKILLLLLIIPAISYGQVDIVKRKLTVDTVRARVDSVYFKGGVSLDRPIPRVTKQIRDTSKILRDTINALKVRTALAQNIKSSDTARWASIPIDDIFDWSTNKYTFYSTQAAGKFDNSSTNPIHTDRCNWDGYLYATKFIVNNSVAVLGIDVNTTYSGGTAISGTSGSSSSGYGVKGMGALFGLYGETWAGSNAYCIGTSCTSNVNGVFIKGGTSGNIAYSVSARKLAFIKDSTVINGNYTHESTFLTIMDKRSVINGAKLKGPLITGIMGTTERYRIDPHVSSNSDSTAYIYATDRQLLSTAKHTSFKNLDTEIASLAYDGTLSSNGKVISSDTGRFAKGVRAPGYYDMTGSLFTSFSFDTTRTRIDTVKHDKRYVSFAIDANSDTLKSDLTLVIKGGGLAGAVEVRRYIGDGTHVLVTTNLIGSDIYDPTIGRENWVILTRLPRGKVKYEIY